MNSTQTALQILQAARNEVLKSDNYSHIAYYVLCNAILHVIGVGPEGRHTISSLI